MAPDVPDVAGAIREVHDARNRLNRLPANPSPQQIDAELVHLRQKIAPLQRSEHITPVLLAIDEHLAALNSSTLTTAAVHRAALEGVRQDLRSRMSGGQSLRAIGSNSLQGTGRLFSDTAQTLQSASLTSHMDWHRLGANILPLAAVAGIGLGIWKAAKSKTAGFLAATAALFGFGFNAQRSAQAADIASRDAGRVDLLPAGNTPANVPGVPGLQVVRQRLNGPQDEVFLISNGTRYRLGFVPAATPAGAPQNISSQVRTITTRPGQTGVTLEFNDPALSTVFNTRGLRANADINALTQLQAAVAARPTSNEVAIPNIPLTIDITNFTAAQLEYAKSMSTTPPVVVGTTLRITTNLVLRAGEPVPQLPNTLTTTPPSPATPALIAVPATQPVSLPGGPALAGTEGATAEHNNIRLTRLAGRNAVRVDIIPPVTVAGNRTVKINGTDYSFNVVATGPVAGAAERPEAIRGQTLDRGRTRLLAAPRDQAVEIASTNLFILGRETIAANTDGSKTFKGITVARTAAGLSITPTATADAGTYKLKIGANEYTFTVAPIGPPVGAPENISDANKRRMDAGTARVFSVPANQEVKLGTVTLAADSPVNIPTRDPASKITLERLPGGQLRVTLDATTPAGSHALKVNGVETPIVVPALSSRIPGTVNHGSDITGVGTADLELVIGATTKSLSAASATADFGQGLVFSRKPNGDIAVVMPHTHPNPTATVQLKRGTETKNVTVNREAAPAGPLPLAQDAAVEKNKTYELSVAGNDDVVLSFPDNTGMTDIRLTTALPNGGTNMATASLSGAGPTRKLTLTPKNASKIKIVSGAFSSTHTVS